MKTVILAAGPGTSLFPLANCHPQLAFPVGNRPLLAHQFDALRQAKAARVALVATDDAVDLYRRLVEDLRGRERFDLPVDFITERVPAGTAGSLRAVEAFAAKDDFLLIAGGVHLAALDLAQLIAAHRARGAALTVVTQPDGSVPYIEHVDVDAHEVVRGFHLMHHSCDRRCGSGASPVPDRRSSRIAAGVYVIGPAALALVKRAGHMDLKEQLVPAVRAAGLKVYAHHQVGATRLVSSLRQYVDLNADVLESGRAWTSVGGAERQLGADIWVGSNVHVSPTARLKGPILIDTNSVVGPGATITGPTTIGSDCVIEANASIERSVIWSHSRVGCSAQIRDSVVAERCDVVAAGHVSGSLVVRGGGRVERLARLGGSDAAGDGFKVMVAAAHLVTLDRASLRHRISTVSKRALDVSLSLGALVMLAPLFATIGLVIRLDSKGPALYCQRRCGKDGREFRMWKFRTMVPGAERQQRELFVRKDVDGPMFKLEHDPRVTCVGRILRKMSLDELPQLVNVLMGDMSLVGPRPLVMDEMKFAPGWRDMRLRVRPGISGLWQVNGRSNVAFHDWIHHDIQYVTRRSLELDVKILVRTLRALRIGEGAK